MSKRRTPLKGKPFSRLSDKQLKQYMGMFQDFIHCFKFEDKQKEELMREVWKLLQIEDVDRWDDRPVIEEPEKVQEIKKSSSTLKVIRRPLIKKRR